MKPWFDYFDDVLGTILNTSDESLDVQISNFSGKIRFVGGDEICETTSMRILGGS